MMGQNNLSSNYAQQKANRAADLPNVSKLKAEMSDVGYPSNYQSNLYLFKNPIFEEYFSNYVEGTQAQCNECISKDLFDTIQWDFGIPQLVVELIGHIHGKNREVQKFFMHVKPQMSKFT